MSRVEHAGVSVGVQLLDTREVAKIIGCSEVTVRRWRVEGYGPCFIKCDRRMVRYHPKHVEDWVLNGMHVNPSARSEKE